MAKRTFLILFFTTACGDAPAPAPAYTEKDSAGVRVIEHATIDAERVAWTIPATPALTIGKQDGDKWEALHKVAYAAVLSSGDIAVVNGAPAEVFLYDSTGRYKRSAGRPGVGPGELRYPTWAGMQGDSLVVLDEMYPSRINVFDATGRFMRRAPLSVYHHLAEAGVRGTFGDGSFLLFGRVTTCQSPNPPRGLPWNCVALWRSDHRSGLTTPVASEFFSSVGNNRLWMLRAMADFDAQGDHFTTSLTHAHEVRRYDASGALRWISRVQRPLRAVTQPTIDEFNRRRDSALAQYSPAARRDLDARIGTPMVFPDSLSAYTRIVAAADSGVWAQRYEYPEETALTWDVFSAQGIFRGSVKLEPRFLLHQVGRDFIVGTWRDSLDVEYVRLFRLR